MRKWLFPIIILLILIVLTSSTPTAQAVVYYGKDLNTKGNWIGKYGASGYILCAFDAGKENDSKIWQRRYDRGVLPSYISNYTVSGTDGFNPARVWTLEAPASDERALLSPKLSLSSDKRRNAHWYTTSLHSPEASLSIDFQFQSKYFIDTKYFFLSLYFFDVDQNLTLTVQISNQNSIDTVTLASSETKNGVYARFLVYSPASLTIKLRSGNCNPCVSGIFIDEYAGPVPQIPEVPFGPITIILIAFLSLLLKKRIQTTK